jgi:hypothetical protein
MSKEVANRNRKPAWEIYRMWETPEQNQAVAWAEPVMTPATKTK